MKALSLAVLFALLGAFQLAAYAAPVAQSTGVSSTLQAPLPADEDKDKEKDKDKKEG